MLGRAPLIVLAAAALVFVFRIPTTEDWRSPISRPSQPVAVGLTATALLPVAGMIVAKFVTHAFTDRYFIAALPAAILFLIWALPRVIRNDRVGPAFATAVCLVLFAHQWRDLQSDQTTTLRTMRSIATLLRQTHDAPIVMSEVTVFHRLSFYAEHDLVNRLVYVADPYRSVRYLGHDTVDRGLLALVPWFPLKVVWWDEWWRTHSSSLVYGFVGDWTWVTFALPEVGTTEVRNRDVSHLLLHVTRTAVPDYDRQPGDPTGTPMLFDQLPANGPSLCKAYMPTTDCQIVDSPSFSTPIISYPDLRAH
jgi:hypothetical protein